MKAEELKKLFRECISLKDICVRDNLIFITLKIRGIKIILKKINVSNFGANEATIFVEIYSKNLFLENHFKKLQKALQIHGISFSLRQEKHDLGFRYQISIFRPNGSEYIEEYFPRLASFFNINSCSSISWSVCNEDINFEIK